MDAGVDQKVDKGTDAGADRGMGGMVVVTGTGGMAPGTGGAMGGTGGVIAGTGGVIAGTGGVIAGTGGVIAGTGGVIAGTGGVIAGTGGVIAGTGGVIAGTGGAGAGGDNTGDAGVGGAGTGGAGTGGDNTGDAGMGGAGTGGDMDAGAPGTGGAGTGGACDPGAPTGFTTNFITNTDFESGVLAPWQGLFGATAAVSTTVAHCGTHSAQLTQSQTFHAFQYNLPIPTGDGGAAVGPGNYTFSGWVYHNNTVPIQFAVQGVCTIAGTPNYINITFPTVPPATWMQAVGTLTVPDGCTSLYLQVKENTFSADAGVMFPNLFLDDVYLVQ